MAAPDEVLEAQLASWPVQLVGSDRLEGRILVHVALPSPQIERAQFHLASDDVRRFGAGKNPSGHGQVKLRSEEHTSELQSRENLVCRLLLEKKKKKKR